MIIKGDVPISPRDEQDVVVIGAGAAGLPAAMAAKEAGAKVTVLEKAPNLKDSNLARAGGAVLKAPELDVGRPMGEVSVEERLKTAVEAGDGRVDADLIRMVLSNIEEDMNWLERLGFEWRKRGSLYTDRVAEGRHVQARGAGFGYNNQMRRMAEKMECRVLFSTTGKELITDAKGRVLGIRVETPEGLKDLEAGAVVLATSGFQANEELLLRYHPEEFVRNIRLTGSPYSTGDGHRIAEEVGANLVGMNLLEYRTIDKTWRPGSPGQMGPFRHLNVTARYAVFVNRDGRRFIDENEENDVIAGSIMLQPDAVCAWIMDDKARRKAPEDEIARYERTRPSVVIRADTLEEMAEKIDIPYERLEKNIGEYNNAIRDEKITTLDVPKAACALQIDTPPFYAVYPVWAGLNCTLGGPKVTKKAEVVNMEKRPIPGLYAAGEMVGDYYYAYNDTTPGGIKYRRANVFVAGALLNMCLVLGRVAGTQAANYALHQ